MDLRSHGEFSGGGAVIAGALESRHGRLPDADETTEVIDRKVFLGAVVLPGLRCALRYDTVAVLCEESRTGFGV